MTLQTLDQTPAVGGGAPMALATITKVELVSVKFTSDHDLLKDHDANWKDGGQRYPKPEWTSGSAVGYPVSHSKKLQVKLVVQIDPKLQGAGPLKVKLLA